MEALTEVDPFRCRGLGDAVVHDAMMPRIVHGRSELDRIS